MISTKGISVDSAKVKGILQCEYLKTVIEVRSFMGIIKYYKRYIEDYFKVATPLTQLTRKDQNFTWNWKVRA